MSAGQITQGRRVFAEHGTPLKMEPGDYHKGADERWFWKVPNSDEISMQSSAHVVTEHEDGTITVANSIGHPAGGPYTWHGYLEHGVWREV